MKKIIKKVCMPIFISVLCGAICGRCVYNIYKDKTDLALTSNIVYLIQTGAYSSYDNMLTSNISNDYVYYEDKGLYKTIIGITKKEENIAKIIGSYPGETVITKYFSTDSELDSKLITYDSLLQKEKDETKIKTIVVDMLKSYKEKNINLIKIG